MLVIDLQFSMIANWISLCFVMLVQQNMTPWKLRWAFSTVTYNFQAKRLNDKVNGGWMDSENSPQYLPGISEWY